MISENKVKWLEFARRGKAQPLLIIDTIIELYRKKYFSKAHKIKWTVQNYRQFDNARWFGEDDVNQYQKIMEKASHGKKPNLFDYGKEYKKRIDIHKDFADKYKSLNFNKLSNQKLNQIYQEWYEIHKRMWCFAYDYVYVNRFLPDIITSYVTAKVPDIMKQNEYLGILFEADEPSEMRLEKKQILNIVKLIKQKRTNVRNKSIQVHITKHLEEFAHLGFYYFRGAAYKQKDIENRINEYFKLPKNEFDKLIKDFKKQDQNERLTKEIVVKLKFNTELKRYVKYIKRWGALSNYVDETYGYVIHQMWQFWHVIAKRLGVPYNYFYDLTNDEIIKGLKLGKLTSDLKREAKQRHDDHLIEMKHSKKQILSGPKLKQYYKKEKIKEQSYTGITKLYGQSACPGLAKGRVKTVYTVHDVRKVEVGDILVASATNPTYVPAMERAAAILTDEGGLLSHAAIVSRELKVPCIVGTKISTKVLKDGDKVSVDAVNGIVKVL